MLLESPFYDEGIEALRDQAPYAQLHWEEVARLVSDHRRSETRDGALSTGSALLPTILYLDGRTVFKAVHTYCSAF